MPTEDKAEREVQAPSYGRGHEDMDTKSGLEAGQSHFVNQNGGTIWMRDVFCYRTPALMDAGGGAAKTRLESVIKTFNPPPLCLRLVSQAIGDYIVPEACRSQVSKYETLLHCDLSCTLLQSSLGVNYVGQASVRWLVFGGIQNISCTWRVHRLYAASR